MMRLQLLLLCISVLICADNAHVCMHDEVMQPPRMVATARQTRQVVGVVPFTIAPILVVANITMDTVAMERIDAALFEAVRYFSTALRVTRLAPSLAIPPTCEAVYANGPAMGRCAVLSQEQLTCGPHATVPQEHTGEGEVCDPSGQCRLEGPAGSGVEAADYILYITAIDDTTCVFSPSTIAFAAACFINPSEAFRPIAGYVNFCPRNALRTTDSAFLANVAIHEVFHAVGFSRGLFQFFVDENQQLYQPFFIQTINGRSTGLINSTQALRVAREHFSCPTLEGIPLENEGGASSASSHWEARALYLEIMTSSFIPGLGSQVALSALSLAVLADSGWYQVDLTATSSYQLLWGKGLGCSFPLADCLSPAFPYSCPTPNAQGCIYDHTNIGVCRRAAFLDGCNIFIPLTTGTCPVTEVCLLAFGSGAPGCVPTQCVVVAGTDHVAYLIDPDGGGQLWCFEGQVIGGMVCAPPALVCQRRPLLEVNTIPPPLCDGSCAECSVPADPAHCTLCAPGLLMSGPAPSSCVFGNCTAGTFGTAAGVCQECVQGCALCRGELNSECLQCQGEGLHRDTTDLLSVPCVAECINGTFPETNAFGIRLCQACPSSCSQCSSPTSCQQCQEGFSLHEGECLSLCPQGFRPQMGNCVLECTANCLQCTLPLAAGSNPPCEECSPVHFLLGGVCTVDCPQGFYEDNQQCRACPPQCRSCTDLQSCTLCSSGFLRLAGECLGECPRGFQPDFSRGQCLRGSGAQGLVSGWAHFMMAAALCSVALFIKY